MKKIMIIIFALFALVFLSACNTNGTFSNDNEDDLKKDVIEVKEENDELMKLTIEQLAMYNGENGNPSYIAVNGVVYNITGVSAWASGSHNGGVAGTDVTELIGGAGHGESVLEDLEIVGEILE